MIFILLLYLSYSHYGFIFPWWLWALSVLNIFSIKYKGGKLYGYVKNN